MAKDSTKCKELREKRIFLSTIFKKAIVPITMVQSIAYTFNIV
jgi:hypothetical protein